MTADLSRMERLVWHLIEDFHVRYGTDADSFDGEDRRVLIRDIAETADTPRLIPFEEILDNFEEIARLESDEVSVWDREADREVYQHDADYCAVRAAEVEHLRDTITAQIRALLA